MALEQADGLWELEKNIDDGDGGDPFPGIKNNRSFTPCSAPNSSTYDLSDTYIQVSNISNPSLFMTADLRVTPDNTSPGIFSLISPPDSDTTALPVDLNWTDPSGSGSCSDPLYELHYSTDQDFPPESTSIINDIQSSNYVLTSELSPYRDYFWKVKAFYPDGGESWSSQVFRFHLYLPGDVNNDEKVSIPDVVSIVNYLFKSSELPTSPLVGDVNQDCTISIADAVYLINFLFRSGSTPQKGCA